MSKLPTTKVIPLQQETAFEIEIEKFNNKTHKTISVNGNDTPMFYYNLIMHKFELGLNSKGIKPNRHWRLKPIKEYYGLKGRSGKDAYREFIEFIWNDIAVQMGQTPVEL